MALLGKNTDYALRKCSTERNSMNGDGLSKEMILKTLPLSIVLKKLVDLQTNKTQETDCNFLRFV